VSKYHIVKFVIQTDTFYYNNFIISMKNLFTILNLSNMKNQLKTIFYRFPISIIFIVVFAWLLLSLLHWDFNQSVENNLIRWVFSSIIWFFFSVWFYLYSESNEQSKITKNIVQLIPIGYSSLFFIFFQHTFNSIEEIIFFLLSLTWIIWFLFFSPYIKNLLNWNWKQSIYYTYFYNISVVILTSCILWWILFALWAIWITAVHQLFDLSGYFTDEIYWDWAIWALWVITPLFALIKIPNKREFTNNYFNENAFFSFLVKYIAIPFIYIYFIILYLYSVKVLMNFSEWPKGEVTWMVIWFSIFWYLIYIFSYIFEEKNNFIKTFRKYFPFAVMPQIFMLFYAIYLRVAQYDITINRYFVIVFWIWLLLISIYYAFSKKKYLWNITVLLTLFTVIISVGPWSVYQLPESRQLERLKNNLVKANILKADTINSLESYSDINQDLSKEIYGWIKYLCDFDNCNEIKQLFPEIYTQLEIKDKEEWVKNRTENIKRYEEVIVKYAKSDIQRVDNNKKALKRTLKEEYRWPSNWEIENKITETIKVKNYFNSKYERKNISIYNTSNIFPLNIKNYSEILELNSRNIEKIDYKYWKVDIKNNNIEIVNNWIITDTINIKQIISKLQEREKIIWEWKYEKSDFIYEIDNKYKLYFKNISIPNTEYTWTELGYFDINWYILIK
jgi:hypothetical protein